MSDECGEKAWELEVSYISDEGLVGSCGRMGDQTGFVFYSLAKGSGDRV